MFKSSASRTLSVGLMLFALFFGAGDLIFPAVFGQRAGYNVWYAVAGFLLTGVGLPLAGVLAMGYSGCKHMQELISRVNPKYALCFSVLVYLVLGPCFVIPRTGTVSYEIAVLPFLNGEGSPVILGAFLVVYLGLSFWLAANPQKLVDRIGKVLTPALLLVILLLIAKSFITPMGVPQAPIPAYAEPSGAALQGFFEGYNAMDAIASFVYGVIVINFVIQFGADTPQKVTKEVFKAGVVAVTCLGLVYLFVAHLGATSVSQLGYLPTGAPVLTGSANILFGWMGNVLMAVTVLLACLSTCTGNISCCAMFFHDLIGGISYKAYAAIFTVISFFVGMFGLETIIAAAVPVVMFIYPMMMVMVFLTLADKMFNSAHCVYVSTTAFAFVPALIGALQSASLPLGVIGELFNEYVPLHSYGLGWIGFAVAGFIIGCVIKTMRSDETRNPLTVETGDGQ